jgi:hypothetical protein
MSASTKPLSPEEMKTIAAGEVLTIDRVVVQGTYKNGLPFVREYPVGADLLPTEGIAATMMFRYPDPLEELGAGVMQ